MELCTVNQLTFNNYGYKRRIQHSDRINWYILALMFSLPYSRDNKHLFANKHVSKIVENKHGLFSREYGTLVSALITFSFIIYSHLNARARCILNDPNQKVLFF